MNYYLSVAPTRGRPWTTSGPQTTLRNTGLYDYKKNNGRRKTEKRQIEKLNTVSAMWTRGGGGGGRLPSALAA